jgi:hypothetical protein
MEDDLGLSYKQSGILFLRGVHLKDYLGIEDRVVEKADVNVTLTHKPYDTIPVRFISWADWPANTNLKCWHCDFVPSKEPVFIPRMVEGTIENIKSMTPLGNFCNFSCAAGYIMAHYIGDEKWRYIENLKLLLYLKTEELLVEIEAMPERSIMTTYGGHMSVDDYKNLVRKHNGY